MGSREQHRGAASDAGVGAAILAVDEQLQSMVAVGGRDYRPCSAGYARSEGGRIITSTPSGVGLLEISNAMRLSRVGWSKSLAREVAKDGITANIVLPGRVATDRIRFLDESKAKREGRLVEEVNVESTRPFQRPPRGICGCGRVPCERSCFLSYRINDPRRRRLYSEHLRIGATRARSA